jgi:hypothetical protein
MANEATKTEYAIALAGLAYIAAFTIAEQLAGLGEHTYRQVRDALGVSAGHDADATSDGQAPLHG